MEGMTAPHPLRTLAKNEPSCGYEQHGDRDASEYLDRSASEVRCFAERADRSAWVDL